MIMISEPDLRRRGMRKRVDPDSAELAVLVRAPAFDSAALDERADRGVAGRDLHGVSREGGRWREERREQAHRSGAEATASVTAAALHCAVREASAGELL